MVDEEDRVVTESFIRLGGRETDFHVYEGAGHWFFESGDGHEPSDHHDAEAADLAWQRTTAFLATHLQSS